MNSKSSCHPRARPPTASTSTPRSSMRERRPCRSKPRRNLRGRPPLTFEDLSWPPAQAVAGDAGDLYRGSAQLFVGELLRLPDGRACLRGDAGPVAAALQLAVCLPGRLPCPFPAPARCRKMVGPVRHRGQRARPGAGLDAGGKLAEARARRFTLPCKSAPAPTNCRCTPR